MSELLPCPFCAGNASLYGNEESNQYNIMCHDCESSTSVGHLSTVTNIWNRRAGNTHLTRELSQLAAESVKRDIMLAKLEAEVERLRDCAAEWEQTAALEQKNYGELCMEMIELQDGADGWIPVSERLPDIIDNYCSENVLVAVKYKHDRPEEPNTICTGYLMQSEHKSENGWWAYSPHTCEHIDGGDTVTHWMPLPEPPKY